MIINSLVFLNIEKKLDLCKIKEFGLIKMPNVVFFTHKQ